MQILELVARFLSNPWQLADGVNPTRNERLFGSLSPPCSHLGIAWLPQPCSKIVPLLVVYDQEADPSAFPKCYGTVVI